jgi:fatty-acid desaturase
VNGKQFSTHHSPLENYMQDIKNILLAFYSYWIPVVLAIDLSVVSAIVLPILFFAVGKAIDVGIQFYFHRNSVEKINDHQT